MRSTDLGRYALSSCVAAAMLAACGGSQPPIGAPGAMPQSRAIVTHASRGGSWMLPEAKDWGFALSARRLLRNVHCFVPSGSGSGHAVQELRRLRGR